MIRFRMLGTVDLRDTEGRELRAILRRPKLLALLAYLGVARPAGFHRRDALVALLWPELDHAHARNALRQAVHSLREALGRDALVSRSDEELAVNDELLSCDVREFEMALDAGEAEKALELHRGGLLAGLHVSDVPEFERWLDDEREHVRRRASEAARLLTDRADAGGNPAGAARWAQRQTELSPSDESVVRRLVDLLDRAGDRPGAVRAYEEFKRRLARDLELEPSTRTQALIQSIRARRHSGRVVATGERPARPDSPSDISTTGKAGIAVTPTTSRKARLIKRLTLGAVFVMLVGGLVVAAPRTTPALDPNLLAVAPFEVLDPRLELWREGMVDVLARSLDGAGPVRTVSPTVAIRRWQGRGDREAARAFGSRTHAAFVVFGQLLSAGPDSVRLTAAVLDTRSGRTVIEIDRADQVDRMHRLTDSVSVDVIRALMPKTPGTHIRLYSVGTRSLPALKAFLQGEHFFRRFALDSAIASYDRAVAIDTAFALALRRLHWSIGWNDSVSPIPYYARAAASNHGLSPRDSLLVLSDSGMSLQQRIAVVEAAGQRYPDDPEVWYVIGENLFHGFYYGLSPTWSTARAAFDRAIALDSGFAPAYVHPVQIALNDNDADAAHRYVRGYLAISSVTEEGAAMRLLSQVLDPRDTDVLAFDRKLEIAAPAVLRRLALATFTWPDAEETQIRVWTRALSNPKRLNTGGSYDFWPPPYALTFPSILIHRGHLKEARGILRDRFGIAFMQLAELGAATPETVEVVLEQWLRSRGPESVSLYPYHDAGCSRTFEAALWWASRKDTSKLRQLVAREELAVRGENVQGREGGRQPVPAFVRAALALAQGDTTTALDRFLAFPDSLCSGGVRLREIRFRLLAGAGRSAEAAAVFDRSQDRWVPLVLERARLAERLGDHPTAIKYYRFAAQAWLHSDPELQPIVAEARAAVARVSARSSM